MVFLAVGGAIVATGVAYWAFAGQRSTGDIPAAAKAQTAPSSAPAGPPPVAVETAKAVAEPLPKTISAVGSLRSEESVTVRPESPGRISAILFKEGERVSKGKPLIRLDAQVPEAELAQARASQVLAKSKLDRTIDLQKQGFVSQQARDEAENALNLANAAVQLAQAKLSKFEIRAPFTGVIGLRSVSEGDYLKEGQDIVNLESIDPLKVDFRVPEIFLAAVQVGQSLQISFEALPGKTFAGKVYAINPLIDAGGRSVVLRANVQNKDLQLRPGMFARVRLLLQDSRESVVIPETALVPQGADQYVFRVVDGRAQRIRVEVGQRVGTRVEVMAGLAAGELIVTAGQLRLRDGATVKLAAAKPVDAVTAPKEKP
jgi:membrane fusion protein (multidrug efflux system)